MSGPVWASVLLFGFMKTNVKMITSPGSPAPAGLLILFLPSDPGDTNIRFSQNIGRICEIIFLGINYHHLSTFSIFGNVRNIDNICSFFFIELLRWLCINSRLRLFCVLDIKYIICTVANLKVQPSGLFSFNSLGVIFIFHKIYLILLLLQLTLIDFNQIVENLNFMKLIF